MEFLTKDPVRAIVLSGEGILTNIPSPDRYAIHKIMVSQLRREENRAKRTKDLYQAMTMLTTMESEYPQDLSSLEKEMSLLAIRYGQEEKWEAGLRTFNKFLAVENVPVIHGLSSPSPDEKKIDEFSPQDIHRSGRHL